MAGIFSRVRFAVGTRIEVERAGRRLRELRRNAKSIDDLVGIALAFQYRDTFIRPLQLKSEISQLLELVRDLNPRRVLEIGTDSGGTLYLFAAVAAPNATIVSVDSEPYRYHPCNPTRLRLYELFAEPTQTVRLIAGDSHSPETVRRVQQALGGDVDLLFVDGDHSRCGVAADAEAYLPMVRPGGLVAFHDIQPDLPRQQSGVADWWHEFSPGRDTSDIIEDRSQAGYGIGVFRTAE